MLALFKTITRQHMKFVCDAHHLYAEVNTMSTVTY